MAEIAPTTATATTATPLPAPGFTNGSGGAAVSHAAAAEKTRAAFAAAKSAEAAPAAAAAAPAAPAAEGIKTEGLADLTRLSADKRRLEGELAARDARIKELEPGASDAKLLQEVRDLYKGGKRMEAIGKLSGMDPTGEMEALLADYLKPDAPPEVADKLAAKVEEVAKRIDEKAASAQATEADAVNAKHSAGVVVAGIKAKAAALPHLSTAEEGEAVGKVLSAFTRLRFERGFNDQAKMTTDDVQAVLDAALTEADIEYEVRAVRAGRNKPAAVATPAPAAAAPASLESIAKPGVETVAWGKTLTHGAAKEKLAAALRAGK